MLKKCLGVGLVLALFLSVSSFALDFRSGDNIAIAKGTVINDNLFMSGNSLTVSGTVKGNLFVAGNNVIIDGNVTGTIFASGGEIYISGRSDNAVVGGGRINISGIVNKDLLAGGGQINLEKGSRIGRDAMLGCGETKIAGRINRNLYIGSNNIVVAPSASVKGNLNYSAQKAAISDQAKIFGTVTAVAQPEAFKKPTQLLAGWLSFQMIIGFLAILLVGVLVIIFLPHQVELVTNKMTKECWKSFGWGILSLIVIPLAAILLLVTLIGFPLGAMLLVAYIIAIYVAAVFVSIVIGKWILARIGKADISLIWALLIGLVIIRILAVIPILGWIFGFILFLWAFGALVSTRYTTYIEAREAKIL